MSVDVVCFGETMALIAPDPPRPLTDAQSLLLSHAGAESNVAISLTRLGTPAAWCSRLGDDPLGRRVLSDVTATGVSTALVRLTDARTGVLIKSPAGAATTVLYYRDHSAAAGMDPTDAERALVDRPRLIHLTGITPALSPSCSAAFDHALGAARRRGVTISFDVNHRARLWPSLDAAAGRLQQAAQLADIVFVGLDEATRLWGTEQPADVRELLDAPAVLLIKDGARGAHGFHGADRYDVPALPVEVIEPVGAGDAFAAGWLHAHLTGRSPVECLRLGHLVAAASLRSATDHGHLDATRLAAAGRADAPWPPTDLPEGQP
jgi:2-dehydro-3-deoxygluconokinase